MSEKILITGASSGIGKEYAYQFGKMKKELLLVARNKEALKEIKKDLEEKYKIKCEYYLCDLSSPEEIKKLAQKIEKENIDVLVNNAGFGNRIPFSQVDSKVTEDMINVHILATTLLTRSALPYMIKKNKGTIINVASLAGYLFTSKSNIIYNSTKRYVIHFSRNLQDEINKQNKKIKVQALCPGFTRTNFDKTAIFKTMLPILPSFMYMEADEVVRSSIKALKKRKVVFVPGFKNRVLAFLLKLNIYK
jgi:short-subunit dehydrogenase